MEVTDYVTATYNLLIAGLTATLCFTVVMTGHSLWWMLPIGIVGSAFLSRGERLEVCAECGSWQRTLKP